MGLPLVSVIIPCYRHAHFLPKALESIFRQTFTNIEIIVVNDGSDDDTEQVALGYGNRIKYVYKDNGGLPSARNTGALQAIGQYLLFLDADDLLATNAIAKMVEAMQGRINRLVIMGWRDFENDPHDSNVLDHFIPADIDLLPTLIDHNLAPPHSWLLSKSMFNSVGGFREHLRSCEDYDLWLRLAIQGAEHTVVRMAGSYYRKYAGSMSTNHRRMLQTRTEVLIHAHDLITARPDIFEQFGRALYNVETRVRRRWYATKVDSKLVRLLNQKINQLEQNGIESDKSWKKKLIDIIFGSPLSERLSMMYLWFFDPEFFEFYRKGHY